MRAKSEKIVGDAVHVFLGSGERGSPVVLPRKVGGRMDCRQARNVFSL